MSQLQDTTDIRTQASSQAGIQSWISAPAPVPFDREYFDPELSALIVATAAAKGVTR